MSKSISSGSMRVGKTGSVAKGVAAAATGVITGAAGAELFNKFGRKPQPAKFAILGDLRLQGLCMIAGIMLPLIADAVAEIKSKKNAPEQTAPQVVYVQAPAPQAPAQP